MQVNKPCHAAPTEECQSDTVHAKLLSSRVQLHDGVWLVDDNIRVHSTVMVKLSVRTLTFDSDLSHNFALMLTLCMSVSLQMFVPLFSTLCGFQCLILPCPIVYYPSD